jgi:hypothetical protein
MENKQTKTKWFWPWQDEKEEAWLEQMSAGGWHLRSVGLIGRYTFVKGEPRQYTYRLDYMYTDKNKLTEYLQIFQDAGWEYVGEMSNWRYWRKLCTGGETPEIFTDNESKIKKYRRVLLYMAFFLFLMIFLGMNLYRSGNPYSGVLIIDGIYFVGRLLYAIIIPIYIVVCVKLLARINQLKKKVI